MRGRADSPRSLVLTVCLIWLTGCGGGGGARRSITQLSGLVATIDTGSPIVDALVTVDGSDRGTRSTVRGSYFLEAVELGEGWRRVRAQKQIGAQVWDGERAVLFDRRLPIQNNLLIAIGPENRKGTIRGRVTTPSGSRLGDVTVFLNPEATVASAFRITDLAGGYEFQGVPAGTYTVVASAQSLVNAGRDQVVVSPGRSVTVDLSMLVSAGASVPAPSNLVADALTYPDNAASVQARIRAVHQWLVGRTKQPGTAHTARRLRIQNWPAGTTIETSLSWSPPSATDLAGYVLERAIGSGSFETIDRFADPTASAYYDLDPVYTTDQTYRFQLSAVSSNAVQSQPSNTASARPLEPLVGLAPAGGATVSGPPTFSWQAVNRAQRYQVLVLSRPPELTDVDQMPLVWPPAANRAVAQTSSTQLVYSGPALQSGVTYYWTVFAFDQQDPDSATAVSASRIESFQVQ
jgi:carboxypeptidase family protein